MFPAAPDLRRIEASPLFVILFFALRQMSTLLLLALVFSQVSAQPARLTGHITGLKDPSALPVILHNPKGSELQSKVSPDGTFEFASVPPGSYTLRAPGFTTVDLVVDGTNLDIDLKPTYSGPGVTVSGKVKDKSSGPQSANLRTMMLTPLFTGPIVTGGVATVAGTLGGSLTGSLETWVRPDGTFEFSSVPSGSYMLRSLPTAAATSTRLEVGSVDVRDLEIVIPFQLETTGRVLLEGRDLGPNATVQATLPTFTSATGIHGDGSFKLRLPEGENHISMARLPAEFSVKKIAYGELDITRTPLKVDATTAREEILITLETKSLDLLPGVSVSGRLITATGQLRSEDNQLRLTPAEGGGKALEAIAHPDGTFEFRNVTPGVYWLQGISTTSRTRVSVGGSEVKDLEILALPRTQVAGTILVVDADGRPYPIRPNVSMVFRVSNTGFSATSVHPDGSFGMALTDSQYTTTVGNLPSDYTIKSISSGPVNLLENPLIVDAERAPDNIVVVLEYRPRGKR